MQPQFLKTAYENVYMYVIACICKALNCVSVYLCVVSFVFVCVCLHVCACYITKLPQTSIWNNTACGCSFMCLLKIVIEHVLVTQLYDSLALGPAKQWEC